MNTGDGLECINVHEKMKSVNSSSDLLTSDTHLTIMVIIISQYDYNYLLMSVSLSLVHADFNDHHYHHHHHHYYYYYHHYYVTIVITLVI
jgi:hypothetical protein